MNKISNEALEFLTEAKEQLSKNPETFTYRDNAANFIALRTGLFDNCIMIYELGDEVGNFTEQLPRQNKVLIDYDERENYKNQIEQLKAFIENNEYDLTPEFRRHFPNGFAK